MGWPTGNRLVLNTPNPTAHVTVTMLGCDKPMTWKAAGGAGGIVVELPPLDVTELPSRTGPWVFKLMGVL